MMSSEEKKALVDPHFAYGPTPPPYESNWAQKPMSIPMPTPMPTPAWQPAPRIAPSYDPSVVPNPDNYVLRLISPDCVRQLTMFCPKELDQLQYSFRSLDANMNLMTCVKGWAQDMSRDCFETTYKVLSINNAVVGAQTTAQPVWGKPEPAPATNYPNWNAGYADATATAAATGYAGGHDPRLRGGDDDYYNDNGNRRREFYGRNRQDREEDEDDDSCGVGSSLLLVAMLPFVGVGVFVVTRKVLTYLRENESFRKLLWRVRQVPQYMPIRPASYFEEAIGSSEVVPERHQSHAGTQTSTMTV